MSESGRTALQLLNILPNRVNQWIGGNTPLLATLTGAGLGAGLGYGLGTLGEQFLPRRYFRRGKLRKSFGLAGAGAGAMPGLLWGAVGANANPEHSGPAAFLSGWPLRPEDMPDDDPASDYFKERFGKRASLVEATMAVREVLPDCRPCPIFLKAAEDAELPDSGFAQLAQLPPIQTDAFGQVIWADPFTPAPLKSATTGLVEMAANERGTKLISPADIGRAVVGMGSGYLSGLIVGKTLGTLAGLTPKAQHSLQRTGAWAGLISNIVPLAFPG